MASTGNVKTAVANFVRVWDDMAAIVNEINQAHGFNDHHPNRAEAIALMHSELSEALESMRHGDPPDKHCPDHTNTAVELADCVIRIMHFDSRHSVGVAQALLDKLEYNRSRPYKHGKLF